MRHIFFHFRKVQVMSAIICLVVAVNFNILYANADSELDLKAPSALLMESSTGKILYDKNSSERRPLASITKVMTMLIAMEEIDGGKMKYDDIITGSEYAKSMGGSTIFLDAGEQLSVRDILKGIAVASGNDAAVAMAEHISGSEQAFVARMNERAKQLGMNNTNFVNCNGLDAPNHYSSAYDIALMSRELLKHPDIHQFTTIWMDSLRDGKFTLSNTNKLIRFYEGATGLKTGSTGQALFCVSATAKRDNMHLIGVIMASPTSKDRVSDASKLLNYGFANYGITPITRIGDVIGEQPIEKGIEKSVNLLINEPFDLLTKKGAAPNVELKPKLKEKYIAPVKAGTVAGVMEYFVDGQKVGEREIVFEKDINKIKFKDVYADMFNLWLCGGSKRA